MKATPKIILKKPWANFSDLKNWALFIILMGICFAVYANSFSGQFVSYDDFDILEYTPTLYQALTNPISLLYYISFKISGNDPFGYHLIAVIIHSLNTFLVFIFLTIFFKRKISLLGAVIFAVHPIHTEAVTWIAGKAHLYTAFFMLSSYLCYYQSVRFIKFHYKKVNYLYYLLSLSIFFYWSVFINGFSLLFPAFILLSNIYFKKLRHTWRLWLPFVLMAIFSFFIYKAAITNRFEWNNSWIEPSLPLAERIFLKVYFYLEEAIWLKAYWAIIVYSFLNNVWLLIFPLILRFYHEPNIIILTDKIYNGYAAIIIIISIILFLKYRVSKDTSRKAYFILGFILLFFIPTFTLIPIASIIAERYLYIPSIAWSMFLCLLYECLNNQWHTKLLKVLLIFIFGTIIIFYTGRTILRNADYDNAVKFWETEVKFSNKTPKSYTNLGYAYFLNEEYNKAIIHYKKSLEIDPTSRLTLQNLILAYLKQGKSLTRIYYDSKHKKWKEVFKKQPVKPKQF